MPSFFRDRLEQWWRALDHGQQISLSFFAPCAVLALILAVVSLRASITMPFRAPTALLQNSRQLLTEQRRADAARQQLDAGKDTDGDGILDQDEAGVFRTSAYLADTDSDGVSDGEEIRVGTDPNCPPDRDCYGFTETSADAVAKADMTESGTDEGDLTSRLPLIEPPKPVTELTPTQIREYLVRNNLAEAAQVGALPDEGVIELYRRAYDELRCVNAAQSSGSSANVNAASTSTVTPSP